jgi:hypothetical protein
MSSVFPDPHSSPAISLWSEEECLLDTDPACSFWQDAPPIAMNFGPYDEPVPGHETQILSRWTATSLYFLFACSYLELHLKPEPEVHAKQQELWNWDVAEVFIGSCSHPIWRYKEFQVSPQGEWLDLEVDLKRRADLGFQWDSGFEVSACVDFSSQIWYGAMRIPRASIGLESDANELEARVNFFRSQGPQHLELAWRPTYSPSFHVPEQFGVLRMAR